MNINNLTTAEEKLMTVLWKLDTFYMKDVMEQHPEPKPHQNTVSTYLKILVEKGFLGKVKEGRIFKYSAAIPFDDYRKYLLKNFVEQFCNNSDEELIALLQQENMLVPTLDRSTSKPKNKQKASKKQQVHKIADEILNTKKKKKKKKKK